MFKRIRYFSIAVTDLDEAVAKYEKLFGLKLMTEPNVQRVGVQGRHDRQRRGPDG